MPTQWKGDDTFFAVGYRSQQADPPDLLTCSTGSLRCTVAVSKFAPAPGDHSTFRLPLGVPGG